MQWVSLEEARDASGLRLVTVGGVPSPWGEAAKGVLHVKKIPFVATRLSDDRKGVFEWTGSKSAPVAVFDDEPPRTGWAEILLLAERLAPTPALLPAGAADRALVFGLCHELSGEEGLGWSRRLAGVHAGLTGQGGFAEPVARYLGDKYGYRGENGESAGQRVIDLLALFAGRLRSQREAGSDHLVGDALCAADLHLAAMMAMFGPLSDEDCPMPPALRAAFETLDAATREALDPILFEHRDRIYREHLALPVEL
jgi:glutathione S-transferase